MRLFVIGNGFDKAHGMETGYIDLRYFIEEEDYEYIRAVENMYNICSDLDRERLNELLWKDFERKLSEIQHDVLIEDGSSIELGIEFEDIGVEDTLNEYWEDRYGFIEKLNEFLLKWISSVEIKKEKKTRYIDIENNDLFITFNYTMVLEELYGIEKCDILHIHGGVDTMQCGEPVLGHGAKSKIHEVKDLAYEASENFDEKKASICNAVVKYYERTLKDVDFYLSINKAFFEKIRMVDEIFVVGHSLGEVDMPYFEMIKNIANKNIRWKVFYYSESDKSNFEDSLKKLGLKKENYKLCRSEKFFNYN